jgi:hypothetical protein
MPIACDDAIAHRPTRPRASPALNAGRNFLDEQPAPSLRDRVLLRREPLSDGRAAFHEVVGSLDGGAGAAPHAKTGDGLAWLIVPNLTDKVAWRQRRT